tara:strand:+ start:297 stop:1217 length:921 start_codon:yes stop_codon:yes gene_type:complete
MKVGILHEKLEWTEKGLRDEFERMKGVEVELFDVRKVSTQDLVDFEADILLNRVYASVANRDYGNLERTLVLVRDLEDNGVPVVNSLKASMADYSKIDAFHLMKEQGVRTAETILYVDGMNLENTVNESLGGFPIIVKRNAGGRGKDLAKCFDLSEIKAAVIQIISQANYNGGVLLQEFTPPNEPRDYRVWVIGGEVLFYHGRSLITTREEEFPWLASRSLGSQVLPIETSIPKDLEVFALHAAKSIGATIDVLDVVRMDQGYSVIEHNPTPNLNPAYEEALGFNPVTYFAERIVDMASRKDVAAK